MSLRLPLLLLALLVACARSQIIIDPHPINPELFWPLQAEAAFNEKAQSMPGAIGAPRADQVRDGKGYHREYEKATLYWEGGAGLGAFAVNGAILARYKFLGGPKGVMGFPTSDWTSTADGRDGWYNTFRNGAIYWMQWTGAWEVSGKDDIYSAWSSLQAHRSWLGYPVTGVQPGASDSGVERISAFENGFIYYNERGNRAVAVRSYRDILIAKYKSVGGPLSRLGLPYEKSMPAFRDGLCCARMGFRGGSVWVPLDTIYPRAQYQVRIRVRFLGLAGIAPQGVQRRVSGAVSVFVPSTRAIGPIFKINDWRFTGTSTRPSNRPDLGGNPDDLLYDGPPANLLFMAQHIQLRTSNAGEVAGRIAATMGLDVLRAINEADGSNPTIDVDKAYAGEQRFLNFRLGLLCQQWYSGSDNFYPPGYLEIKENDLLRITENVISVKAFGSDSNTPYYEFRFGVERREVWENL
ncbi:hypothetical protein B0T16DRAFT_494945 [Cercophora newfieldiana]|uniref:Uncharacterized protein n=1 Tax=Cercophora newfieldiana TaxID=92897 RepID=A0AA39Y124_9PEZI|nr:hypothetical protein B0T16DRAFT_494945 [Cercophora newfieldiana]